MKLFELGIGKSKKKVVVSSKSRMVFETVIEDKTVTFTSYMIDAVR